MRAGTTTDPGPPFSSGLELRTEGLFAGMIQRSLTPFFTPTDPNTGRLRATRLNEHHPEIPVCQGITRHHPARGHLIASLEQNPAYGTAQAHGKRVSQTISSRARVPRYQLRFRDLLAGGAEAREEEYMASGAYSGPPTVVRGPVYPEVR